MNPWKSSNKTQNEHYSKASTEQCSIGICVVYLFILATDFCAYSVPVAHNNLISFEGSRFRDPLPSIGEAVSEKHMGVCTEERPVMHWVSKHNPNELNYCIGDGNVKYHVVTCIFHSFSSSLSAFSIQSRTYSTYELKRYSTNNKTDGIHWHYFNLSYFIHVLPGVFDNNIRFSRKQKKTFGFWMK